jgi:transposase
MQPTQPLNGKPTLDGGLELADKAWKLALTDGRRPNPTVFTVDARDLWERLQQLLQRLQEFKRSWGLPAHCQVTIVYEAGQDGFWIARALQAAGVRALVIDAASVKKPQHEKNPKTDRLDALKLLQELRAWLRWENRELRVLHIPSEEQEASRLISRERGLLQKEISQHRDRMTKLLRTQGYRQQIDARFVERLVAGQVRRADSRPIPEELWQCLLRECERLELAKRQFAAVEHTLMHQLPEPLQRMIAQLARLNGVGWVGATRLILELFWRDFANRRQVGACVGLVAQPHDSGNSHSDQGISKQGNRRVRALLIQMAWMWLRYQPHSALAQWFARRTAGANKRGRRIAIVAVARRLAIDLWRYLREGIQPLGAELKNA